MLHWSIVTHAQARRVKNAEAFFIEEVLILNITQTFYDNMAADYDKLFLD